MTAFYNTTGLHGRELQQATKKAVTQDAAILSIFMLYRKPFGPAEMLKHMKPGTPITSVRRAMNTLTKDGYLIKTIRQVPGMYGKAEHVWALNPTRYKMEQVEMF